MNKSAGARPIFIGGTSSNAGKSWMATALMASLRRRGVSVAPFKAQNMSNNSHACRAGGEIGRAQAAQAEACGLEAEPAMNPILLKPCGEGRSQVVVNGRVWKTLTAREYYAHANELREVVTAAYEDLSRRFDVIVIEGAGSVSELNLRAYDLVNLELVTRLGAPWLLVADIERGGVFGAVVGTFQLLTDEERRLCRGFAINRFRGDASLFEDGVAMLERLTSTCCLGVFPHAPDIALDAEDSLALTARPVARPPPGARIAIVHLPHISNATDMRLLTWADWISSPPPNRYDFVILPGTKSTIGDLAWLRASGLAAWIVDEHRRGATVVGVCGGYQMLGRTIRDPYGIESGVADAVGLGLLPVTTEFCREKQVRPIRAVTRGGVAFDGYAIHLGVTSADAEPLPPFARSSDGSVDGSVGTRVLGTYLHGALENPAVCAEVFGIPPPIVPSKDEHYARLADWFDQYVRHADRLGLD